MRIAIADSHFAEDPEFPIQMRSKLNVLSSYGAHPTLYRSLAEVEALDDWPAGYAGLLYHNTNGPTRAADLKRLVRERSLRWAFVSPDDARTTTAVEGTQPIPVFNYSAAARIAAYFARSVAGVRGHRFAVIDPKLARDAGRDIYAGAALSALGVFGVHGFPAPTIEDFERLYGPVGACPRVLFGDPAAARAFRESHPDIAIAAVTDDRTRAGDPLTISYADITVLGMFVTGGDWPPRGR